MKSNNTVGAVVGAMIVLVLIGGSIWYTQNYPGADSATTSTSSTTINTPRPYHQTGTLYVGITDASAEIQNVNEITMRVNKVEIHSPTQGWTTIGSENKAYNLLTLKSNHKIELYAKGTLGAGAYDQVRVTLGDTTIQTKHAGEVQSIMPSKEILLTMAVNMADGKDTQVKLDFIADKSLHTTTEGKYVFTPVVLAESQSNTSVLVSNQNAVTFEGGITDSSLSVGVDLDGLTKKDFSVDNKGMLKMNTSSPNGTFILSDKTHITNTIGESTSVQTQNTIHSSSSIQGTGDPKLLHLGL